MKQKIYTKEYQLDTYKPQAMELNAFVSPFGNNRAADIAYRKAERIVLATHLVTNALPEEEPVRDNVRTCAQSLLPATLQLRDGVRLTGQSKVYETIALARNIMSLLDVMHASGYISTMNLEILKGAYADLATFLRSAHDTQRAEPYELDETHFAHVQETGESSKGQKKDIKDTIKDSDIIKDKKPVHTPKKQSIRAKHRTNTRRMAVLDAISKQRNMRIKDIAGAVPGCSEKTVQRELLSLIRDGIVEKSGSKRWTTYSLVN